MAVKNLLIRGGADFSGIQREMSKTQKTLSSFQTNVSKIMKGVGVTLAAIGVGKLVKDSLDASSDLEGAMLGLKSILDGQGRSFTNANKFIQDYIKDGLVPLTDAVGAYKNLAARGYDDKQIQQVMSRLKDSAAFGRQSGLSLGEAVKSATEGLKNENSVLVDNAGVTKNVAKMWDEYAKSIGTSRDKLTDQQKIQAEVNGIMKETQWQVGDAAKYTETYAGRVAALKKTLQDVKVNLGNAFMPIANIILPLLQVLANGLARVTSVFAQFSQALFGKTNNAQAQTKAADKQALAVGNLGDAAEGAGKKAKKAGKDAQQSLAGFDEINSLSKDKSNGDGEEDLGEGGIGNIGGTIPLDFETNAPDITNKIQGMTNNVKAKVKEIVDFISQNKDIIISCIAGLVASFATFEIIANWSTIIKAFDLAFKALAVTIGGISVPILAISALIGLLVGNIVYLWRTNENFRDSVIKVWQQIKDFVTKVVGDMWSIVKDIWDKYGQTLMDNLKGFMKSIQDIIVNVWENIIKPLIKGALEMLDWLWDKHLKALVEQVGIFVMKLANAALEIWNKFISPIVNWMVENFAPPIINVIKLLINNFGSFLGGVCDVAKGLFKALGGIIDFIAGVFTGDWAKAWQGVKDIFGGVFDSLVGLVKVPLNLIINAINFVLDGLNKINIKTPDWLPGDIGGKSFGVNIPKIPKLAQGGYVGANNPMLAMIGDNRMEGEIVAPESKIYEQTARAINDMLGANMNNDRPIEITFQVGYNTLGKAVIDSVNKVQRQAGKTLLEL